MRDLITDDDVEHFLRTTVAAGVAAADGDREYEQCDRFIMELCGFDDTYELVDGPADGGVDVMFERTDEESATFDIVQLSAPQVRSIKEGRTRPNRERIRSDVLTLFRGIRGEITGLSNAAMGAFTRLHDAIAEEGQGVSINLLTRTLYEVSDEARLEIEELVEAEVAAFGETVSATYDVVDVRDFTAADLGLAVSAPHSPGGSIELVLEPGEKVAKHGDAYLLFADPAPLIKHYDAVKNALLHLNLRGFQGRSSVNKGIENSVQRHKSASRFHMLNNGMVILATVSLKRRSTTDGDQVVLRLSDAQVVNGGQTLHTLWRSWAEQTKRGKSNYVDEVRVPIKVIHVKSEKRASDDRASLAGDVAAASNTQNSVSARTLQSHHPANRALREAFARFNPKWFLEIADKDWSAMMQAKSSYLQRELGVRALREFKRPGGGDRKFENTAAFEALLSFYGCFSDARRSSIWKKAGIFPDIARLAPLATAWTVLAGDTRPRETFAALKQDPTLGAEVSPELIMLAFLLGSAINHLVYTDADAKRAPRATWSDLHGRVYSDDEWADETKLTEGMNPPKAAVFEWCEHVANSMKRALLFQTMRLLVRRYGPLTPLTCTEVLRLPQLRQLMEGESLAAVLQPATCRSALVGAPETPVYSLLQVYREASGKVFASAASKVMTMTSRQRELMTAGYVERLSKEVDQLSQNLALHLGTVPGIREYAGATLLEDILPPLGSD
jgi:AIPR protein